MQLTLEQIERYRTLEQVFRENAEIGILLAEPLLDELALRTLAVWVLTHHESSPEWKTKVDEVGVLPDAYSHLPLLMLKVQSRVSQLLEAKGYSPDAIEFALLRRLNMLLQRLEE